MYCYNIMWCLPCLGSKQIKNLHVLYFSIFINYVHVIMNLFVHVCVCFFFALCRIGAIFFMVMNQIFSNMNAVDLFIRQKALFM